MKKRLGLLVMMPVVAFGSIIRWIPFSFVVPMLVWTARWAHAKVFISQEEALKKAFPGATQIERRTVFLSPVQAQDIEKRARAKMDSQVHTYYVGRNAQGEMGLAFFDTRIVRTMPATFMAVIRPDGALAYVEVLSFHEPEDYFPRLAWLALYNGRRLTDDLRIRRRIPNVTGASLTCQTINDSVRLMLAVHEVAVKGHS